MSGIPYGIYIKFLARQIYAILSMLEINYPIAEFKAVGSSYLTVYIAI